MTLTALAFGTLTLMVITMGLGLASLLNWVRHRSVGLPVGKVVSHVVLQVVSIGVWLAFSLSGEVWVAWLAFVIITAGQVFGDLLMFASHDARHPGRTKPGYSAVASDLLSFKRPIPALHAIVGALAWFSMLAICIAATVTA